MVSVTCSTCGTINDSEDIFCRECGGKVSQVSSPIEEKFISGNGTSTKYILNRLKLNNVKSTFSTEREDQLLYRVETTSNTLKNFIYMFLILGSIYPGVYILLFFYRISPFKGLYVIIIGLIIFPLVIIIFLLTKLFSKTLKYKVISENNDEIGIIQIDSKFFNLKSAILGKDWKFTTTDSTMAVSLNFPHTYEGILTNHQFSYYIKVNHDKFDKRFYGGVSKIEGFNEQNTNIISIDLPDSQSRRKIPPRYLEIIASDSINELLVVFVSIIIIHRYFLLVR